MVVVTVLTSTKETPQIKSAASIGVSHQNLDLDKYLKSSAMVFKPLFIALNKFLTVVSIKEIITGKKNPPIKGGLRIKSHIKIDESIYLSFINLYRMVRSQEMNL
jgi:hypothetical protein